jgi:hypothetical protein
LGRRRIVHARTQGFEETGTRRRDSAILPRGAFGYFLVGPRVDVVALRLRGGFYDVLPGSAVVLALVDAAPVPFACRYAAISALSLSRRSRARIGSQPPDDEPRASTILPICKKFKKVTDGDRTRDLL